MRWRIKLSVSPGESPIRLRQHGTFVPKRMSYVLFRPAGGTIPCQTRDRLLHGSSGRFAVFAHVVVFVVQTPTA